MEDRVSTEHQERSLKAREKCWSRDMTTPSLCPVHHCSRRLRRPVVCVNGIFGTCVSFSSFSRSVLCSSKKPTCDCMNQNGYCTLTKTSAHLDVDENVNLPRDESCPDSIKILQAQRFLKLCKLHMSNVYRDEVKRRVEAGDLDPDVSCAVGSQVVQRASTKQQKK